MLNTIILPHSKRQNSSPCILDSFLDLSFTLQNPEKTTYFDNLAFSFSWHSLFFVLMNSKIQAKIRPKSSVS